MACGSNGVGGVRGADGLGSARCRRRRRCGFFAANELARVEGEERSFDLFETFELHGGLDVQVLFLHLGLEFDDAADGLVHRLAHRLLEPFDLDAHEFDLAGGAGDTVLHLVDRIDVDAVESTRHGVDRLIDLVEAGLGAGDAIAERRNGVVESGADPADVGVDVGNTLADGLVDASFGGEDPLVDAVLGLVDASTDDVRHLGLLTSGLGRHLVHAHRQRRKTAVELLGDLIGHLVEPGLGGLGHRVEVLDHRAGLLVELADAAVERRQDPARAWPWRCSSCFTTGRAADSTAAARPTFASSATRPMRRSSSSWRRLVCVENSARRCSIAGSSDSTVSSLFARAARSAASSLWRRCNSVETCLLNRFSSCWTAATMLDRVVSAWSVITRPSVGARRSTSS